MTRLSLITNPLIAAPRNTCEAVTAPDAGGSEAGGRSCDGLLSANLKPSSGYVVVDGDVGSFATPVKEFRDLAPSWASACSFAALFLCRSSSSAIQVSNTSLSGNIRLRNAIQMGTRRRWRRSLSFLSSLLSFLVLPTQVARVHPDLKSLLIRHQGWAKREATKFRVQA